MDLYGKKRKELQALCKEHNIPANLTNLEMANKLASLLKEKAKPVTRGRSCLKNLPEIDSKADSDGVNRKIKKVRFSPKNETIEFVASQKRTRLPEARKGNFRAVEDVESVGGFKDIGDIPVRVTRSRAQRLGEVGVVPLPDSPVVKTRGRRVQKGTNTSYNLAVEVKKGGEAVVDVVAPEKNLRQRNGRKRSVEVFEDENVEPEKALWQTKQKGRRVEESELGKTEMVGMERIMRSRTNLEVEASALHNEVSKRPRRDVNRGKSLSSQAENRNSLEGKLEVVLPFGEPSRRPRRTRGRTKPVMPPDDNGDKVHEESEVGVKEPLQRPRRTGDRKKSVMPQVDNGDKVQGVSEVGVKEPLQQPHRSANGGISILPNAEIRDKVEGKLEVVLPLEEPAKRPSRNDRGKSIAPQIDKVVVEDLKEYEMVPEPEGCSKRSRDNMLVLKPAADKETVGCNNSSKQTGGSSKDTDMFLTKENVRRSRRNTSMQDPVAISDGMRGTVSLAGKNKRRKRRIDPIQEEETVEAEVAHLVEISTRRSRRDANKSETIGPAIETGKSVGKKRKPTPLKLANLAAVSALHSTPAEEDAQSSMAELAGRESKAETVVPTVETGGFVGEESHNPLKSPSLEVEAPSSKATLGIETPNTEDAQFSIPQLAESDIHPVSSSKKDLKHSTAGQSKKSCKSVRALKEDSSEEAGFGTSNLDREMANVDKSVRMQTGSRTQEMEKSAGKSACTAKTDYSEEDGVGTSDLEVNTANTSGCKSVRSQTQYRLQGMQIPVSESLVVTQDLNMPPAVDTKNSIEDCIYRGNECDSAFHSLHRTGNLGFKLAEKDPADDSSSPGDTVKQKELETELEPSTCNAPGSNQSGCSRKDFEEVTKVAGEAASVNPSNEHDITSVILSNNDVLVEAAESHESSELQGKVLTPGDSSIVEPRFSVPEDGESGNIENHGRIDGKRAGGTLKSCSGKEQGREQGLTNVFHGPSDMNSVTVTLEKTPASNFVKLQTKSAGHVMAFSNKKLACPAAVERICDNEGTAGKISGSDGFVINKSDCFEEVNDPVEVMEQEGASSPLRNGAVANIVGGDGITCLHKEENLVEVAEFDETDYHKNHEILSDPNRETSIYDSSSRDKNYIKVSRERTSGGESFEGTAQTVLVSPLNAIAIAGELTKNEVDACSFSSPGMTPLQANTNSKEQEDDQVDTQDTLECGMLRGNQRNNAEREESSSLAAETCDRIITRQEDFAHEAKETKHASSIHKEVSLPITAEETADGGSISKWHGDEFKNLFSTPVDQRNLYKKTSDCDYREGWQGDQLKNLFATPVISTIGLPDTQISSRGNSDRAMFVGSSSGMASGGRFCRGMYQETVGADGREQQITPLKEVALPGNSYEVSKDGLDEAGGVEQVDACSTAKDCEFTEKQMTSALTESTFKCMKGIKTLEEETGSPIGSDIVGFDHGDEITKKYLNTPAASARDLPEECKVCDDISSEDSEEKISSAAMKVDSYSKDTVDVLMDGNVLKNNDLKFSESDGNVVVVVPEMDESATTSQKLSDKRVRNVVEVSELIDEIKNDDYADQGQNILQDLYERTFVTLNECVSRDPANEALKERSFDVTKSPSNLNEANIGYSGELKNVGLMGGCLNIDSSLEKEQDLTNALQVSPGSFFHQLKGEKEMVSQKASSTQLSVSSCQEDEQELCANGEGLNAGQKMADVFQDDELNNIHGFGVPALASDEFQGYTVNALTSTSEPFHEDDNYRKKYRETMTQSDPNRGGNKGDDLGIIEVVPRERLIDTAHSMSEGAFVSNTFCESSGVPSCGNEVEVTAEETDQAQSPAHSSGRILCAEDGPMEIGIGSQTFSNWEIDLPFEGDEVGKSNARTSSKDFTCEDDKDAGPNENLSVDSDLPTSEDVEITLDEVWMEVDKMSGDESKDDYPQEETFEKVDLEENQPLVEEKYEDGREAIQKQSLASFDFAFDEGNAENAQTGELIERKNFDPEAEEGNNPSANQFFSTTMKRKIARTRSIQATPTKLFMSDFKENVPGFKIEHPGALTEVKLVTKRRALEDLRKK